MTLSKILMASAAALALTACGDKGGSSDAPETKSSAQAAKANAASPLDSKFTLKNADEVEGDKILALLPGDANPTYDSTSFDAKLGATVFENLKFADADDGEAIIIGRAEFYGVDEDAIAKVQNKDNAAIDAPFQTVFEKVRLFDVSAEGIDAEDASFSIGGVELDKLAIREGGVDKASDIDEGAQFFNAVSLGGLYFKDINLAVGESEAGAVRFTAPDLRFVGLGGGKLNAVIMNDLEYGIEQSPETIDAIAKSMGPEAGLLFSGPLKSLIAPENQNVKMSALEWRNIDMSGLLEWGLKDEKPPASARNLINLGTMKATDMETYINGKRLAVVEEADMTAGEFTWMIPSDIRLETKGAQYDLTAYAAGDEDPVYAVLKDNGLDKLTGDGLLVWKWNDKSGDANMVYTATADGFADMGMNLSLADLKLEEIAAERDEDAESPKFGALKNFSLELKDEKALDTLFAISALQMGGTGDDLRQSAPAMIRLSGAQFAQMNPAFSSYVNAVADFVAKGGSLKISAQPEDPLAFSALQNGEVNPMTLPQTLNLEVTHAK
ncbi:MAG: hypothetical protein HKN14_05050 [Marinicaulis sp.]|nr:hypothetical protein [Marinicaulis sp.]